MHYLLPSRPCLAKNPPALRAVGVASAWLASALLASALLASLLASGCAAQHMAVAPDVLSSSEALPIVDRSLMSGALVDESFKLGPFQVARVDRKWTSTSSARIGPYSSADTTGGYTFALQIPAGGAEYKGECASRKDSKSMSVFGGELGKQIYEVLCSCAGPTQASLSMKADTTSRFTGSLQTSQGTYALVGIYTRDSGSSSSDPLGYEIRGAEPLGAVEILGRGRAWMSRTVVAPAREEAACLYAGLLLYKPPQTAFEK